MSDNVTLGEVFRLVEALKDEHGEKLDKIDQQVRLTNGRTTRLEVHVDTLKTEVRSLKHAQPAAPSQTVSTAEGESLSIKVSPKMWALIASAFAGLTIFAPMVSEWVKNMVNGH